MTETNINALCSVEAVFDGLDIEVTVEFSAGGGTFEHDELTAESRAKADQHPIPSITGLQSALDGKANSSHVHNISDVTGLQSALDGKSNIGHGHHKESITGLKIADSPEFADTQITSLATEATYSASVWTYLVGLFTTVPKSIKSHIIKIWERIFELETVKDITYSALVTLINSNGLISGKRYRITDFATVNYLLNGNTTLTDINTGSNETLIVTAISNNSLDKVAQSESNPKDLIYYDWNPANWLADISFSIDGINIITNWKGVIYFRKDTKYSVETHYDWRNVKLRRWKLNPVAWDIGTTYAQYAIVQASNGKIYYSISAGNVGNDPTTSEQTYWRPLIDYNVTDMYISWTSSNFSINHYIDGQLRVFSIPCSSSYIDYLTFGNVALSNENENISIGKRALERFGEKFTIINNILLNVSERTSLFSDISFASMTYNSTIIGERFYYNKFERYFYNNLMINYGDNGYDLQGLQGGVFSNVFVNIRKNVYHVDFVNNICCDTQKSNIFHQVIDNNYFGRVFSDNIVNTKHARNLWGNYIQNCKFGINCINNNFKFGRINICSFGSGFEANTCNKSKTSGYVLQFCTFGDYFNNNIINNDLFRVTTGSNLTLNTFYETYDVYFGHTTNRVTFRNALMMRAHFFDGWKTETSSLDLSGAGYLINNNYYKKIYCTRAPLYVLEFIDTGNVFTIVNLATNTVIKTW